MNKEPINNLNEDNIKNKMEKMVIEFIIEKDINDIDKICMLKELTDYIRSY